MNKKIVFYYGYCWRNYSFTTISQTVSVASNSEKSKFKRQILATSMNRILSRFSVSFIDQLLINGIFMLLYTICQELIYVQEVICGLTSCHGTYSNL